MRSIGRDPLFVGPAPGAELVDVDGNRYVDWVLLLGPADRRPRPPGRGRGRDRRRRATARASARPRRPRSTWRPRSWTACPAAEMVRMVNSGTEAAMSAIRLARAATGREKLLKFAGAYHGHVDGLLAEAGSGLATPGIPASPGRARRAGGRHRDRAVERPRGGGAGARRARVRGAARRALPGQHGPGAAAPRASWRFLREQADRNRRAAGLRRGDLGLPRGPRRRTGARGRHARPDRARAR